MLATLAALTLCACQSPGPGSCGDPFTPIHEIQGTDLSSPLVGQSLVTEGIVTAHFLGNDNQVIGAFVQSEAPDNNPNTSDALYAAGLSDPVGNRVRFSGIVEEQDSRLTAINTQAASSCGASTPPEPSPVYLPLRGRHIESLEAMAVTLTSAMRFSDVTRIGSDAEAVAVAGERAFSPTEVAQPGHVAEQVRLANLRRSITLDDLSDGRNLGVVSWWPDATDGLPQIGQSLSGLTGIIDNRRGYRLRLTDSITNRQVMPRSVPPPPTYNGNLRVVGFNVLNLFNGNGKGSGFPTSRGARSPAEYQRQLAKLVAAVVALNPDVLALAELENDGAGSNSAVADLQRALVEASGRPYKISALANGSLGDDDIAVGLLYASDKVTASAPAESLNSGPFANLNRPPLAQTLIHQQSGQSFSVVSLHLKSKGCGEAKGKNADQRDGQGCWNPKRVEAVTALKQWVDGHNTMDAATTVLIGDFNAYSREDPVMYLAEEGYRTLVFRGQPKYSYVYRGAAGSLDQAMAGRTLSKQLAGAAYWHINADFPAWLDYREDAKPANLYQPDPLRSSDHDPLVVDFRL